MGETEALTFASILSSISTLVQGVADWSLKFAYQLTAHPLLLAFVIVGFVGVGVTILKRLTKV